jgi:hypothetical protein
MVALDIDPRHDGQNSLLKLVQAHGALPDTVVAVTGSGGNHVLFAYPEDHHEG